MCFLGVELMTLLIGTVVDIQLILSTADMNLTNSSVLRLPSSWD